MTKGPLIAMLCALACVPCKSSGPIIRGVNLGGWLVLEPWITPNLFETANEGVPRDSQNGFAVADEYTWRSAPQGWHDRSDMLVSHWYSWVTWDILQELKNAGITHLRIPVGYWYFKYFDDEPFGRDASIYPVALGLLKKVTNEWSKGLGLKVLIDLHTAPGSQNGFDNSGRRGPIGLLWGDNLRNRWASVINALAQWCASNLDRDVLFGVEVLNEPAGWDPAIFQNVKDVINPWGYQAVRGTSGSTNVVFQTAFMGPDKQAHYDYPEYSNSWFDDHSYQCFGEDWNNLATQSGGWDIHLNAACQNGATYRNWQLWTFAGEFSLATTDCTKYLTNGMNAGCNMWADPSCKYKGILDQNGRSDVCEFYNRPAWELSDDYKQFLSKFARAQMDGFEQANGWFFWNFRTENGHAPEWDYLLGIREGWMPKWASAREPYCQIQLGDSVNINSSFGVNSSRSHGNSSLGMKICHGRSAACH